MAKIETDRGTTAPHFPQRSHTPATKLKRFQYDHSYRRHEWTGPASLVTKQTFDKMVSDIIHNIHDWMIHKYLLQ